MEQLFDWRATLERETLLTEAYFGETPGVQRFQKAITKFRDKFASEKYHYNPQAGDSPEMEEICKSLEDEFGFGTVVLFIENTVQSNAMTLPVGWKHDEQNPEKYVKKTKDGYRYDKSADYTAMFIIWGGLIYNREKYTDREVCAILLHEVGHNFSTSINRRMAPLQRISRLINILTIYPLLNWQLWGVAWKKVDELIKDCYKQYPNAMKTVNELGYAFKQVGDILTEINIVGSIPNMGGGILSKLLGYIYGKLIGIIQVPGMAVHLLYGYNDEKFADGFATMYGYGPDLHSAMDKLSEFPYDDFVTGHWIKKNLPLLAAYMNIMLFPILLCIMSIDEHPAEMERLYSSIRVLENELKECDPKRKKKIQQDLDKLKKQLDDYYIKASAVKKDTIDVAFLKRSYYGFLAKVIGGDFRHHIFDRIFKSEYYLSSKGDKEQ